MIGAVSGLTVCFLVLVHAIAESRAFVRVASSHPADAFDALWLISCLTFVAYEAIAAACALNSEGWLVAGFIGVAGGGIACLAGVRLRCLAVARLGQNFSQAPLRGRPPVPVQDDVYAIVRHPSELGLLLFCFGLVAIVPALAVLLPVVTLIVPFAAARVAREERWLQMCHAPAHREFRATVPCQICATPRNLPALISLFVHFQKIS
jgi:protein-S-isoprenylcysteine O-methyltransferase Ste14